MADDISINDSKEAQTDTESTPKAMKKPPLSINRTKLVRKCTSKSGINKVKPLPKRSERKLYLTDDFSSTIIPLIQNAINKIKPTRGEEARPDTLNTKIFRAILKIPHMVM